jgi:hypothetical protein
MLTLGQSQDSSADPVYIPSGNYLRDHAGANKWLVLGGTADISALAYHTDPALRCAAILLAGKVSPAEFAASIEVMPDPAVPIADFAGNHAIRNDFSADHLDEQSLAAARLRFAPVFQRLAEIPFRAAREDRSEILTLRLAYSRASPIEARFAPGLTSVVQYPLLGRAAPKRVELEGLAFRDLLRRRHFMRVHACDRCVSNRLLAFEACPDCGSSDLADEAIVHHYRCGCQAPESNFIHGASLVCPKCQRNLKHFGMDYGKPGTISHCRNCGASSPEPDPRFVCLDCSRTIEGHRAIATDWFHYDLTDSSIGALRTGQLPSSVSRSELEPAPATHSLREFQLLASAALRSARKSGCPFTVVTLTPIVPSDLRGRLGGALVDRSQLASSAFARALSENEFVTLAGNVLLIGFTETSATDAAALIAQARATVAHATDSQIDFDITVREGEEAIELLSRF